MSGLLTVRDSIRDFLRKYDEITTPIIRFIAAYIMFLSINSLYGYSDLFDKGIVVFLLSVICALVSDTVAVLIGAVVIMVNAFSVSIEIGAVLLVTLVVMYCLYMRLFPTCGWILAFVPIMYMLKLSYAIPLVVVIFAGASGIVPTAFGVVLYHISVYVKEIVTGKMTDDEEFQAYTYIFDAIVKNRELLVAIIVFSVVILITSIIYSLSFDYSWYVAIGVGGLLNILVFLICGSSANVSVGIGSLILSSILGIIIALFVQACKSLVDYSAKETVQFEDDDYYYYVKAIPKFGTPNKKKKSVKNMTEDVVKTTADKRQNSGRQAVTSGQKNSQSRSTGKTTAQNRNYSANGRSNGNSNGRNR